MDFPFKFECEYSPRAQGPFESCSCTILPLALVLELPVEKKVFKLLDMRKRDARFRGFMLTQQNETVCLKVDNQVDFKVCDSMLAALVPEGDYADYFKKEEPLEALSTEHCELFISQQRRTRLKFMVRRLPNNKKSTCQEIEAIWLLQNRCLLKPDHIFIDGNTLKLIYKPFSGTLLKRAIRKKRLPDEDELRQFAVKLMFFLSEIENKGLEFGQFREQIILLQGMKYSCPVILDLSSVQPCDTPSKQRTTQRPHLTQLASILFRVATCNKTQQNCDWPKLCRWLSGEIPAYCQAMTFYRRSLFEFLHHLHSSTQETQMIMKHKWLIEKGTKKEMSKRLATIKSVGGASMSMTDTDDGRGQEVQLEEEEVEEREEEEGAGEVGSINEILANATQEYQVGEMTIEVRMTQLKSIKHTAFRFGWAG